MSATASSKVNRVKFTDHQRKKLAEIYNSGLKTTKRANHDRIREVAKELGLTFKNVKYFIENHGRPAKPAKSAHLTTLKLRKPSAYNLFVREKLKIMKGKPPGEEFQAWAEEWNSLPSATKKEYQDKRELLDLAPTTEKERMARVEFLWRKLDLACNELGTYGTDIIILSCDVKAGKDVVLGNSHGKIFLNKFPSTITTFRLHCRSGVSDSQAAAAVPTTSGESGHSLEKRVREALNCAYRAATGKDHFPYSDHHKGMVTVQGLPDGLQIPRSMGSMGKGKLKELLEAIPDLKFVLNSVSSNLPERPSTEELTSSTLPEPPCNAAEEMSSSSNRMPLDIDFGDEDSQPVVIDVGDEDSQPVVNASGVQHDAIAMLNYLGNGGVGTPPILPLPVPLPLVPMVVVKESSIQDMRNEDRVPKKSVKSRASKEKKSQAESKNMKSGVAKRRKTPAKLVVDEQLSKEVAELAASNQGIVEKIYGKRKHKGAVEYRVKWLGYDNPQDDTWEPLRHLSDEHSRRKLREFQSKDN